MDGLTPPAPEAELPPADGVSVARWFAAYAVLLVAAAVVLALSVDGPGRSWGAWRSEFLTTLRATGPVAKLAVFWVYISLCCTFLPLPTGGIVAAVATRQAAVGPDALTTTLLVAAVGASASTVANLNDYHLFTWILRNRRVARVRDSRAYRAAARWFARAPFFILVVFNIIPIPVDVVRMLATTSRYARAPFAAANFLGRLVRYAVIAFVTYWWDLGWVAVATLLGLAVVLGAGRVLGPPVRRLLAGHANQPAPRGSATEKDTPP